MMHTLLNISKYRTVILIVGMIAALGIIAQPLLKEYVTCTAVCTTNKASKSDSEDTQNNKKSDSQSESQVSALEAIAPTAQAQVAPLVMVLINRIAAVRPKATQALEVAVKLPKKLVKVLFTVLIAPNAP